MGFLRNVVAQFSSRRFARREELRTLRSVEMRLDRIERSLSTAELVTRTSTAISPGVPTAGRKTDLVARLLVAVLIVSLLLFFGLLLRLSEGNDELLSGASSVRIMSSDTKAQALALAAAGEGDFALAREHEAERLDRLASDAEQEAFASRGWVTACMAFTSALLGGLASWAVSYVLEPLPRSAGRLQKGK